jgi:hypothetical protein
MPHVKEQMSHVKHHLVQHAAAPVARPIVGPAFAVIAAGIFEASENVPPSPETKEQQRNAGESKNVEKKIYYLLQATQANLAGKI